MTGLMPKHATQWACFVYFNSNDHRCTSVKGGDCWLWVTVLTFLWASRSLCLAGNAGDWLRWGWVYELSLFNFYVHQIVIFFFFITVLCAWALLSHVNWCLWQCWKIDAIYFWKGVPVVFPVHFMLWCCRGLGYRADHSMSAFRQMKPMVEGW